MCSDLNLKCTNNSELEHEQTHTYRCVYLKDRTHHTAHTNLFPSYEMCPGILHPLTKASLCRTASQIKQISSGRVVGVEK